MMKTFINGSIDTINLSKSKGLMSTQMAIKDILKVYKVDKFVNRDLSYNRLPSLLKYFEKSDSEIGIYLPALVFSFRGNPVEVYDSKKEQLVLDESYKMVVLDGQHRIKALEKYIEKINDEVQKVKFLKNSLTVQIYFGLSAEDERKLFTDINSNAKRVSMSLITQYDSRDITNLLIQEVYKTTPTLKIVEIELNKSKVIRPNNTAFSTGVRLKTFINLLLFGKKTLAKREEQVLISQYDEIVSYLNKFFAIFFGVLPQTPGDVTKYVLGHEPIQNAIATYLHESIMIYSPSEGIAWLDQWEEEVEQLDVVDWNVKNGDWNKWAITVNPVKGSYKGFLETVSPEVKSYIGEKIG
ncbi:DNA sulfur modification protein DndB [Paenibacillus chungangensis]|uniref:DNA sulfur modification protein DndB n=1 Tax=Paenibacillus chungangensis TaxID=696535 RepID=A0ABW3HU18_9BACL